MQPSVSLADLVFIRQLPKSAEKHCLRQLLQVNDEKKGLPEEISDDVLCKEGKKANREDQMTYEVDEVIFVDNINKVKIFIEHHFNSEVTLKQVVN